MTGSKCQSKLAHDGLSREHHHIPLEGRRGDIEHVSSLADADVGANVEAPQVCTARTEFRSNESVDMDLQDMPVIDDHVQCSESEAGDDIHVPSAGVNKLSGLIQVQKNVIVAQAEDTKAVVLPDTIEKGVVYKEEYLDELLQHVRFQLPSLDAAEAPVEDSPLRKSEEHLDELLQQVLLLHLYLVPILSPYFPYDDLLFRKYTSVMAKCYLFASIHLL